MEINLLLAICEEASQELGIRLPSGIILRPKVERVGDKAVVVSCQKRRLFISVNNVIPKKCVILYFKEYMEDLLEQYKIEYFRQYKLWLG